MVSSAPLLSRNRVTAKLASEPISTVKTIVSRPMIKAVAELVPEIFEISGLLRHDRAEAVERRLRRPDIAVELDLPLFGIERDQEHVVDRQQRPDQQDEAEDHRARFDENPSQPIARARGRPEATAMLTAAPRCVWSRRISTITIGISIGRADNTAATPSAGSARSKA